MMTPTSFYLGQDLPPLIYLHRRVLVISSLELGLVHFQVLALGIGVFPQDICKDSLIVSRCMDPKCSLISDMGSGESCNSLDRKGKGVMRKKRQDSWVQL